MKFLLILLIFVCANVSHIESVQDDICVGEKTDEYFCYFGVSINEDECLEHGYGQSKNSLDFSYFEDINCEEFCREVYNSGSECTMISFDDDYYDEFNEDNINESNLD